MSAFVNDYYVDLALAGIQSGVDTLVICSQKPATFAEANSTYKLGTKSSPTVSAPQDASPSGRKVVVEAISDGSVSADGSATHFALLDVANSRLAVVQEMASPQVVTTGNAFTLAAINVRLPDAV
jgi:hypothetical protein